MSSIMQQLGYPTPGDAKQTLLEEMRKLGASRLEAYYSGGNDEGGVQEIRVLRTAEGTDLPVPDSWTVRDPKEGEEVQPWHRDGKIHEYHPLWEAADGMLSTEFGSWAGDFSAYGTLYADLSDDRVWREGEMSSYDSDGAEY